MRTLSRRRRLAALTLGAAAVFAILAAVLVWRVVGTREVYRPGERIEGLTAQLERSLPDDYPRVSFAEVSAQAGVDFVHFPGRRSSQLPEDMGSGAAWGDFDNDGLPDLYVVNLAGPLTRSPEELAVSPAHGALYHNLGDGTFAEVSARAGVDHRGIGMGAAWGDYDNDGWSDLFVSAYGENTLYRNNGDSTFTDVSREAGIAGLVGFWSGAAWADYDRDGHLDLYVSGYVKYSPGAGGPTSLQYDVEVPASLNPSAFRPERNLLLRNQGDGGFAELAEAAGVAGREGRSLGAAWTDLDEDGWPDLYVANDVSDNALYRNRGDGTFQDVSHAALVADYRGAMGLAVGDWDSDGDTDIFVTHWIAQENALFSGMGARAGGGGESGSGAATLRFMDEADRRGLGQVALDYIGWGTSFFDYDNDGRLDLLVVNGSTFQERDDPTRLVPMPDQLFWNRGPEAGFYDVSAVSGEYFSRRLVGRGAAFADYDDDGDVDVFVVNHQGAGALLRNEGGNRSAWLKVRLHGTSSNRSAIGARLRLVAGGEVQRRELGAQSSYLSQNSLTEHFGLGGHARVDTLEIAWPSGALQRLTDLPANRTLVVTEGEAVPAVLEASGPGAALAAAGEAAGEQPVETGTAGRPFGAERAPDSEEDEAASRRAVLRFWEHYRTATRHRIAGRTREAIAEYEAALALDSLHENTLYYLGNLRFEAGDAGAAARLWERLVAVNPSSSRGHAQLGALYACVDAEGFFDLRRAEAEFRRALAINKEETGPLLRLGEVALLREDLAAAERHLDAVLGSNAGSVEAYFLKSYIAFRQGRRQDAAELFATAVRVARPERVAEPGLGEGDTKSGRPMLAAPTTCRTPSAGAAGLAELWAEGTDLTRAREQRYRELDSQIRDARRLTPGE